MYRINLNRLGHSNRALLLVLCFSLLVSLFASTSAEANSPKQSLDNYFQLLSNAKTPTDPALIKPATAYWLKGVHSEWTSVSRFFLLHRPADWSFAEPLSAGDYASVQVQFNSRNADSPWTTDFEMVKANNSWKIAKFNQITLRALDNRTKSAQALVETYLQQAKGAVKSLKAAKDSAEKERLKKFHGNGAGYWTTGTVQSRMFLLWLQQKAPTSYQISDVVKGESSSVTVNFKGIKRHPRGYPIRFEIIRKNKDLFISSFQDVKRKQQQAVTDKAAASSTAALNQLTNKTDSPEATVRSQLEILQAAGTGPGLFAVMPKIAEQSKPLWTSSRKARASLGRIISVYAGMNSTDGVMPEWVYRTQGSTVTAEVSNPDALGSMSMLLKGIRFTLSQTGNGWKIDKAVIFRN